MKRISIYLGLLLLAFTFSTEVEAQLSDRINNPSTIRAGARPVAGNFGFYIGLEVDQFGDLLEEQTEVENAIPYINVRYYLRDDLVLRGGISMWKKSRTLEGEIDTVAVTADPFLNGGFGVGSEYTFKEISAYTLLHLGIEKHFKASNLLDGYVGVSLPIGYSRGDATSSILGSRPGDPDLDGTTDFLTTTTTRFAFVYGAELFIGANAFVADLPLAIGVELGVRGLGQRGDKFKTEYEGSNGGTAFSGEYYTSDIDADQFSQQGVGQDRNGADIQFSSLKARTFETEAMIRFTLSYFFN